MKRLSLWVTLIISVIVLAVAYFTFIHFNFFFSYPWFDIPLHFLGGFVVGLVIFFLHSYFYQELKSWVALVRLIVVGTLIVGVGWEFFEIALHLTDDSGATLNSLRDLVMDTLGALLAVVLARFVK